MSTVRVILASQSPRRRELLQLIGIAHDVLPAHIDETLLPGEVPEAHVLRLAAEKARGIAASADGAVVIGADTIVVVDDEVLGKPRDAVDAQAMLRKLRARTHVVHTAVAVAYRGAVRADVESVEVTFGELDEARIAAYVATGEPLDKAGAYGIQGYGATLVSRVDGDYFAVMGLPLARLVRLLERSGLAYAFGSLTHSSEVSGNHGHPQRTTPE